MKAFIVVFLVMMSAAVCLAQPGPPVDPDVPISGIEWLLLLGGLLGLRKFFRQGKK